MSESIQGVSEYGILAALGSGSPQEDGRNPKIR
jgi:hypothetical protein